MQGSFENCDHYRASCARVDAVGLWRSFDSGFFYGDKRVLDTKSGVSATRTTTALQIHAHFNALFVWRYVSKHIDQYSINRRTLGVKSAALLTGLWRPGRSREQKSRHFVMLLGIFIVCKILGLDVQQFAEDCRPLRRSLHEQRKRRTVS